MVSIFLLNLTSASARSPPPPRWTDWLAAEVDFIDYHLSLIQGMFVTDRLAFSSLLSSLRFKFKADRVAGWSLTNGKHAHRQAFSISLQVFNFTLLNVAQSIGLWRSSTSRRSQACSFNLKQMQPWPASQLYSPEKYLIARQFQVALLASDRILRLEYGSRGSLAYCLREDC